jgi:hypothetical protein
MVDKEAKADQARLAEQYGGFEMLRRKRWRLLHRQPQPRTDEFSD